MVQPPLGRYGPSIRVSPSALRPRADGRRACPRVPRSPARPPCHRHVLIHPTPASSLSSQHPGPVHTPFQVLEHSSGDGGTSPRLSSSRRPLGGHFLSTVSLGSFKIPAPAPASRSRWSYSVFPLPLTPPVLPCASRTRHAGCPLHLPAGVPTPGQQEFCLPLFFDVSPRTVPDSEEALSKYLLNK